MENEQKQNIYIIHVMITLECPSKFLRIKTKNIDSYSKLSKNFKFFEISQIVNRQKCQQKQIFLKRQGKQSSKQSVKGKFGYFANELIR
jgi:hypothetical protein